MTVATLLLLLSILLTNQVIGAPEKHALQNECKYNNLESGTYRCILTDAKVSFFVDCMIDGTMYINPGQQALYHYHKQAELEMKFILILSAEYETEDDVDQEQIESLSLKNIENDDEIDTLYMDDVEDGQTEQQQDGLEEGEEDEDSTITDESLESEELTEAEKHSVNLTAQYIVYGVIIVMALIFSFGICLLIYWWCCHEKFTSTNFSLIGSSNRNKASTATTNLTTIDEATPFIDIRGQNTIKRKHFHTKLGRDFGVNTDRMTSTNMGEQNEDDVLNLLQRHNVYDDINGADDNEDGDDLIAHYGATTVNDVNAGYVIAKYPNDD